MTFKKIRFLTDKSYLQILYKIREIINKPDFYPESLKYPKINKTNCGLCNNDIINRDKKRKQFKQRCPFDMRKEIDLYGCIIKGCFHHCYIFKIKEYEKNGKFNIEKMRELVWEKIRAATNRFFL